MSAPKPLANPSPGALEHQRLKVQALASLPEVSVKNCMFGKRLKKGDGK